VARIKKLLLASSCISTLAFLSGCPGNSTAPPVETSTEPNRQASSSTNGLSSARISARHYPLYNAAPHISTIKAKVENTDDSDNSISKLAIYAITGELADCVELDLPSSLTPCRKNTKSLPSPTCDEVKDNGLVECELTIDGSEGGFLATYFAVATLTSGAEISTPAITYSGGGTIANTASPVWWHTDPDTTSSEVDRILSG
jgi:hypothetical protein